MCIRFTGGFRLIAQQYIGIFTPIKISQSSQKGFQLIEVLIIVAIVALLVTVGYPSYNKYIDKTNNALAIAALEDIAKAIEKYYVQYHAYPDSLDDINMNALRDPWGRLYHYVKIQGADPKNKAKLRKDKSLVPVNSDFDLYSVGKDGESVAPFTAKASHDDIVRANNGRFFGLAADY